MECPKCHSPNSDTSRFCSECGTGLPKTPTDQSFTSTQSYAGFSKEPAVGSVFAGRYLVLEELGTGGMGRVFRVLDKKVNDEIALKFIKPEIAAQPKVLERFRNELLIARKIVHKNVCQMYDLLDDEGTHFITMEYVRGENLRSFIKRSKELNERGIIHLVGQVCEGLAEAHRLGIVHRDLKPSNIMIDREGDAKIMDFGIARSMKEDKLTTSGSVSGTPDYMSPEQVEGLDLDPRSDVYSLGVLIYEMATGHLPFSGDTPLSVAIKHKLDTPKPPRFYRPQISEGLSRLILKCLAKDRADRYQDVGQLALDLNQLSQGEGQPRAARDKARLPIWNILRPLKRKSAKPKKRWGRFALRACLILIAAYLLTHLVGFINDLVYKPKLEIKAAEYDFYYKNLFPMAKTWLPASVPIHECNAFSIYKKVLVTKYDDEFKEKSKEALKNDPYYNVFDGIDGKGFNDFWDTLSYKDYEELKKFRDDNAKYFIYLNDLYYASTCSRLNAVETLLKNSQFSFSALFLIRYTRFGLIEARLDLLRGNFEEGLNKILGLLLLALDINSLSNSHMGENASLACIKAIYKDLVTLVMAQDVRLSSGQFESLRSLSLKLLNEIDIEKTCYKEYLWDSKVPCSYSLSDIFIGQNRAILFLFGRFQVWDYGFSWYRAFYRDVELYRGLFDGFKYIKNHREKSIFLKEYSARVKQKSGFLFPSLPTSSFSRNIARMLIKTYLLVYAINRYGMESKEFQNIKNTNIFINEFSGEPFKILPDNGALSIVLDEKYQLNLRRINYAQEHRALLLSLQHFSPQSNEDIKSIFYSFEIDGKEITN